MSTMDVVTFRPPQGCRGEDGPAFQGNFRKGDFAQRNTLTFATITLKNVRPEEFRTHG